MFFAETEKQKTQPISRKKVSHYEKIVKMRQFYSDSSRFFATNCTIADTKSWTICHSIDITM
jgi:hypothetical protein